MIPRESKRRDGLIISYPMSSVSIPKGHFVQIGMDGYARLASRGCNDLLAGVSHDSVDNSRGEPGDLCIRVETGGTYVFDLEEALGWTFIVSALVALIGMNGANLSHRTNLVANIEKSALYQERVDNLLPQLKDELNKYPDHEQAVYRSITSGSALFLTPQLRADKTVVQAVKEIKQANDIIYQVREDNINRRAAIHINRAVGPFFGWVW